jgi:hypothetical protein
MMEVKIVGNKKPCKFTEESHSLTKYLIELKTQKNFSKKEVIKVLAGASASCLEGLALSKKGLKEYIELLNECFLMIREHRIKLKEFEIQ